MNKEFNKLINEILEFGWKEKPVEATFLGIHKYDDKLDKTSPKLRRLYLRKTKEYLRKLEGFSVDRKRKSKKAKLSIDEQMDWRMLRDALRVEIAEEEKLRWLRRHALVYPYTALMGCYVLIMRDFAPLKGRMKSLLRRLRQVPRLMKEGQENLSRGRDIPRIWTKVAIETTASGKEFFGQMVPLFAEKVPRLKKQLLAANRKALSAFDDYEEFLKKRLLPKSKGRFAIGGEFFNFLLSVHHQLPYTADDLLSMGNRIIKQTQAEMRLLARKINPKKSWTKIVDDLKKKHPTKKNLLYFYTKEMARARNFVKKRDLVTIPKGESLSVVETPVFQRNTIPYGAYMPPAPFEKRQRGFFWVTPVNEKLPLKQQEEQLRGHNSYGAVLTALHEAYPGHHLQLVHSNKIKSKVRSQFWTSLFAEGWALYCEELMYEKGFYTNPETRLLQLKDQLWRACRVVIDASLHTNRMSFNKAVEMLVKVAKLEKTNAVAEVKRYTYTPTQPMTYAMGKMEILKLRDDFKKLKGKAFNLKKFHDQLLSYGTIPIEMVRERMLKS
ncbi:MAG: hypothetical protein AMJ91_06560 [candidate division Zixibacteria bacterium SM23_73_3]|nr:MAG: hypothetical protein AMJ91_06560 [candidate division Zixibacteria bacterium SM23_73_3]